MEIEEEETSSDLKVLLDAKIRETDDLKKGIRALYFQAFKHCNLELEKMEMLRVYESGVSHTPCCKCSCHGPCIDTYRDVETQTFESDFVNQESTQSALDWAAEDGTNVTVSDLVRDAVQDQNNMQSDYVYDENYKMYYSSSTGYYYDSERNLLYEPYSQTYYKYDSAKNTYELYSTSANNVQEMDLSVKVNDMSLDDNAESENTSKSKPKKFSKRRAKATRGISAKDRSPAKEKKKTLYNAHIREKWGDDDDCFVPSEDSSIEDGEIRSDSPLSSSPEDYGTAMHCQATYHIQEDSGEKWPPCIRAVVKESTHQKIGDLLIITCIGGVIGREKNCDIHVPDLSISREHARIVFDSETWQFGVVNLNSQNGTFVNGVRVSNECDEKTHPLNHGDILGLGSCKLLIHVHKGSNTCNECEPGIIQASSCAAVQDCEILEDTNKIRTREEREQERRQNLKKLKKKFGLQDMNFVSGEKVILSQNYQDRSETRRKEKGSQNPYEKDEHPVSLETALPSSNKGYKMLKSMGWIEGKSLGTHTSGITEPVNPRYQSGKAGLGCERGLQKSSDDPRTRKWKKAQKRYQDIQSADDEIEPRFE